MKSLDSSASKKADGKAEGAQTAGDNNGFFTPNSKSDFRAVKVKECVAVPKSKKGVGAAFLKNDAYGIPPITAFMHGGEQENGFRAGTLAVHNIVGFGKAAEIAIRDLKANEQRIMQLDQVMVSGISTIPGISLTNPSEKRLPGIISIVVDKKDFNNERFIKNISDKFALSTGSACSAGEHSYVITALGLEDRVSKVLRISLNKYTTEEEIHQLINILKSEL